MCKGIICLIRWYAVGTKGYWRITSKSLSLRDKDLLVMLVIRAWNRTCPLNLSVSKRLLVFTIYQSYFPKQPFIISVIEWQAGKCYTSSIDHMPTAASRMCFHWVNNFLHARITMGNLEDERKAITHGKYSNRCHQSHMLTHWRDILLKSAHSGANLEFQFWASVWLVNNAQKLSSPYNITNLVYSIYSTLPDMQRKATISDL